MVNEVARGPTGTLENARERQMTMTSSLNMRTQPNEEEDIEYVSIMK